MGSTGKLFRSIAGSAYFFVGLEFENVYSTPQIDLQKYRYAAENSNR